MTRANKRKVYDVYVVFKKPEETEWRRENYVYTSLNEQDARVRAIETHVALGYHILEVYVAEDVKATALQRATRPIKGDLGS